MTLRPGLCFPLLHWWTFVTVTTIAGAIEVGGKGRTMTGMAKTPFRIATPPLPDNQGGGVSRS
jgi:hypothetical protein